MVLLVLMIYGFRPIDIDIEALLNHFSVLEVNQVCIGLGGDRQLVFIDLIVELRQLIKILR